MIARGMGLRLSNQSLSLNQLNPSSDNCQTIFKQEPTVSSLPTELRNLLERTVISARDAAEKAPKAALTRLAIYLPAPLATLSDE